MVIMSAKISKGKLLAIAVLIVLAVVLLGVLLSSVKMPESDGPVSVSASEDIRSNEDRIAFLQSFGWKVSSEPVRTMEVRIPTDPSEIFSRYNALQISQGYDLSQYAGKNVMRYVYKVENYPNSEDDFFASLLIYNNAVIGGDVCSAAKGGIMQGFAMPA